jgi:hypothetical protein
MTKTAVLPGPYFGFKVSSEKVCGDNPITIGLSQADASRD